MTAWPNAEPAMVASANIANVVFRKVFFISDVVCFFPNNFPAVFCLFFKVLPGRNRSRGSACFVAQVVNGGPRFRRGMKGNIWPRGRWQSCDKKNARERG